MGIVGRRQPQSPRRLQPAPDPRAQRAGCRACPGGISPHLVPVIEQHIRDVAGEVAVTGRDRGVGLPFDQLQYLPQQPSVQCGHRIAGEPVLDGHVPLTAGHPVPDDRRDGIAARSEQRQAGRAPRGFLVSALAAPGLHHQRPGPLAMSGPGHPRTPAGRERQPSADRLAQHAGKPGGYLIPGQRPGHHAAIRADQLCAYHGQAGAAPADIESLRHSAMLPVILAQWHMKLQGWLALFRSRPGRRRR